MVCGIGIDGDDLVPMGDGIGGTVGRACEHIVGFGDALLVQHLFGGDPVTGRDGFLGGVFCLAPADIEVLLAARLGRAEDLREDDQGCPHGSLQQQLGPHLTGVRDDLASGR